jgi:Predicted membrane protein
MAGLIGTLIIGLIVGAIAKLLMPGRDPGGCLITILIGIAGALIAGYLGRAVGWYEPGEPAGFIASVIGAMLLLLIYRIFFRRAP